MGVVSHVKVDLVEKSKKPLFMVKIFVIICFVNKFIRKHYMTKITIMQVSVIVVTVLMITGCGNFGYIIKTYDSTASRSEFDYQDETYRIFDRKDLCKVMVTPSLGAAALHGAAKGATFGGVNIDNDQTLYQSVATAYLAKDRTTQACKILEGKLLISPQWEFIYLCIDNLKSTLSSNSKPSVTSLP